MECSCSQPTLAEGASTPMIQLHFPHPHPSTLPPEPGQEDAHMGAPVGTSQRGRGLKATFPSLSKMAHLRNYKVSTKYCQSHWVLSFSSNYPTTGPPCQTVGRYGLIPGATPSFRARARLEEEVNMDAEVHLPQTCTWQVTEICSSAQSHIHASPPHTPHPPPTLPLAPLPCPTPYCLLWRQTARIYGFV